MVDEAFLRCRPRLLGVAYGILGDLGEAEDVVQDAWLRLHAAGSETVVSLDAFPMTVTARLAIDRLRSAPSRREHTDGGGEAAAAGKPISGAAKVARFFAGVRGKGHFGPELSYAAVSVNGEPGLRIDASDRLVALIALELAGETIAGIRLVNNPGNSLTDRRCHAPSAVTARLSRGGRDTRP